MADRNATARVDVATTLIELTRMFRLGFRGVGRDPLARHRSVAIV